MMRGNLSTFFRGIFYYSYPPSDKRGGGGYSTTIVNPLVIGIPLMPNVLSNGFAFVYLVTTILI